MGVSGYSHGTNGIHSVECILQALYYKTRDILITVAFVLITTQRCPLIKYVIAIIIIVGSIIILFNSREPAGGTVT